MGINGHDCRGCENWCGCGGCLYDMELEAKELGCAVSDIVNSQGCRYYEREGCDE